VAFAGTVTVNGTTIRDDAGSVSRSRATLIQLPASVASALPARRSKPPPAVV
jgi:hypothetical protein